MVARRPFHVPFLISLLFVLPAVLFPASVGAAPTAEYRVKAAFLLNFTHFVEWPPGSFTSSEAPLTICVIGNDPFGGALDQTIEGESLGHRPIVVRRSRSAADARTCHLLFISRSEERRVEEILDAVGSASPVLIVSDIDGFVGRGGTIAFFLDRNRIRFEIGPDTARRRQLKLSSQLLRLGRIAR